MTNDDCSFLAKLGGFGLATLVRPPMRTLDYKVAHYDPAADPAAAEFRGRYIFVFWHEYLLFPTSLWGNYDLAALVSRHRDGQLAARAAAHMGFKIVYGSTTRGGVVALRKLMRSSSTLNLTMTPDGPKGPRRQLASGAVYLASRLEIPVVPMGFGYDRPWRCSTWDRFAVPKPYSRARCIFGPPMLLPRKLRRDGLEHYRRKIEDSMNLLTSEAEVWAESGRRMRNERPFPLDYRHRRIYRADAAHATPAAHQSLAAKSTGI